MTQPLSKPKPNQEHLALFIAGLRSGRFEQATSTLTRFGRDGRVKHCCLGVACIVAMENGLDLSYYDSAEDSIRYYLADYAEDSDDYDPANEEDGSRWYTNQEVMPKAVYEWYGFTGGDPELGIVVDGGPREVPASVANDEFRQSFAQIADAFDNRYVRPAEAP